MFQMLPVFDFISSGMKIIILTLAISFAAAVLFPIADEESDGAASGKEAGPGTDGAVSGGKEAGRS